METMRDNKTTATEEGGCGELLGSKLRLGSALAVSCALGIVWQK